MSVASFVAAQRTEHGVPHAMTRAGPRRLSESWFYKWRNRDPTPRQQRRADLDAAVKRSFEASGGRYGSPRVLADLVADGWRVSKKSGGGVDGPPGSGGPADEDGGVAA